MKESIWHNNFKLPEFDSLKSELKTDVLIIGGGIAGILTAYFLNQKDIDCAVVEKNRICSGTTGNTTAKITYQHGLIYSDILKSEGMETTESYLKANMRAFDWFKKLSENIDCDYEIKDNYVYSFDIKKLEREVSVLDSIGFKAEIITDLDIPIKSAGAVKFKNQAQFHPLKFINEIVKKIKIFENTFVREVKGKTVITNNGKIIADKIIVTTHFPFIDSHGSYFLKQYQHRSYVMAIKNADIPNGMYVSDEKGGFSFRSYKDYLLLGGGGHRTGKKGGSYREIEDFIRANYPKAEIKYRWAAQDCISLDSIPYIGNYSKNTPDLYVATGFNKWGMTGSMAAAEMLSDLITDKDNPYIEAFSPSRSILKPQLLINGFEAVTNILNPFGKRCPHLGCSLNWNSAEHSWDCPCHGSRFSEKGRILDNPSNKDLRL